MSWSALRVGNAEFRIDAQRVVDRRGKIFWTDWRRNGVGRVPVCFSKKSTSLDAGTGQYCGEERAPVVTALVCVCLGSSAHLAHADDKRFVEKSAIV